jgi:PLD-like domain
MATITMKKLSAADREKVYGIIGRHLARLKSVPGVLDVQPGFPVENGELRRTPAIIVYVRRKMSPGYLATGELLPDQLEGVPVDVVEADPHKQLEVIAPEIARALAEPTYVGIPGDPIDASFTVAQPLLCHVGPDSGWAVLRDFLAETREDLTCAMYDFNAGYIADSLIAGSDAHGFPIKLAIDDGVDRNSELPIQKRLKRKLRAAYQAQIIQCRGGARFPSAYHEKVAVRDGSAFWLSSGNWSTSSQPNIDPIGDPETASGMYSKGNREWHFVVEDEALAELFSRYIEHDRAQALADSDRELVARPEYPDLFVSLEGLMSDLQKAALAPPTPVAPTRLPAGGGPITVHPVLSPDNYARRVTELIRSATNRLYLQYSYINWTDDDRNRPFTEVLEFLAELSRRDDFDLRIIVNSRDAADKVRVLAENGFNEQVFRSQSRIHNKGIVADGKRVLVSSQNWSGDGFLRNRDAGLIVHDPQIAEYYEKVFLDDWEKRSRSPFVVGLTAIIAGADEPTPPGMVRMTWRDYYED